jgi:hypothetical protein
MDSPSTPQLSGIDQLVAWANDQDHWVRQLVTEVIATRRGLSDEQIDAVYKVLLREKDFADGPTVSVAPLTAIGSGDSAGKTLRLLSLKHVEHVNALAAGQEIEFHPRLTICFGENASGKTGYVRILKRAAAVRTAEAVLPNIHGGMAGVTPRAEVRVAVDDKEATIEWRGEAGIEPLTRVDVFDARAAVVHLAEDLSYSYTPADLSLFPLVADGIERLQAKLQRAKEEREPTANPFLSRFQRESGLYVKIQELGATTELDKLEALASLSDEEEASLAALRERVEALRSGSVRQQIVRAEEEGRAFDEAQRIAEAVVGFDREAYHEGLSVLRTAREDHEQATRQALASESVPGVLGDAWKQFIGAAEAYIQAIGLDPYPRAGQPCVYCRQPLGAPAVVLLQKYREYCNATLRQALERASESLRALMAPLREVAVEQAANAVEHLLWALEDPSGPPPSIATARGCVEYARRLRQALDAEQECPPLPEGLRKAPATLQAAKESIHKTLADLRRQGEERARALDKKQGRLRDLEARLTLRTLMPQIRTFVDDAQWAERARTHLGRFQGIKRGLTDTAKRASTEVMNRAFEERFRAECEALRAPCVKLDFPGREGEAKRRKLITARHGLEDILSEGEQKVIALADFLAEASLRPDRSPVVFDDPVTSLDHKRLRYVVDRIVELSRNRQVIVFTHDIWFFAELLAKFPNDGDEYKAYVINADSGAIGAVTAGTPRTDSFKDRRDRIDRIIREADAADGETRQALIERGYEELRGACEVVVERDLLQDVTARLRPNVKMGNLRQIRADRLPQAIEGIYRVFERCCRFIPSHSEPLPTLGVRPTLDDLRRDWKALKSAREEYQRR